MYDYLIVGAGLFGSVFAHEAARAGKKVLVIDKRNNIAGNVYTEKTYSLLLKVLRLCDSCFLSLLLDSFCSLLWCHNATHLIEGIHIEWQ